MNIIAVSVGAYHPQIVHFAIALVFAGVFLRLVSLTGTVRFASDAAVALVFAGTLACFGATYTGTAAHDPVEQIPGVRQAVVEHEEWGERTRNIFALVCLFELAAVLLKRRQHARAFLVSTVAAVTGLGGLAAMYETASHGGELVYAYAGGVGIRNGDPDDVNRVFVTGVYQQALQDRQEGRQDAAMALIDLAAARFPSNLDLQLMAAEWTTDVKRDPEGAIRRLDALQMSTDNTRARVRAGLARAGALVAQGNVAGANAVLRPLEVEFPANAQIKRRLSELSTPPSP